MNTRRAAVSGTFYPTSALELRFTVEVLLDEAKAVLANAPADVRAAPPKAIVVPHGRYADSGAVMAAAYAQLWPLRGTAPRVVLVGPAHYAPVCGIATCGADTFVTPLGDVQVDRGLVDELEVLPAVTRSDAAHAPEHSIETQLPFLQVVLGRATLVPLLVGSAGDADIAAVLERVWRDEDVLVVSSDLSHQHDAAEARRVDHETSLAIEKLAPNEIGEGVACGRSAIRALLRVARERGLSARTLATRTVEDPDDEEVVGYGAFALA